MWEIGVDTGGTFTDCVAVGADGAVRRAKVLSTSALRGAVERVLDGRSFVATAGLDAPDGFLAGLTFRAPGAADGVRIDGFDAATRTVRLERTPATPLLAGATFEAASDEEAPVLAARLATGTPRDRELPPLRLRLATTRGTNALLERRGAKVAFFVNEGFADLLFIGDQRRPDLFALDIKKQDPLPEVVVEVAGRLAADGSELAPLDLDRLRADARRARAAGATSAAVALLHADLNPAHERAVAEILRAEGFEDVAASSDLGAFLGLLVRAETAVVDAYLAPILRAYLDAVLRAVPAAGLRVMTSAGGLVSRAAFRAKDALLSGPAGGVVGMAEAGLRAGFRRTLGFDMGGTSTDVARYDDGFDYVFSHEVGGARLMAAAVAVETVAAGGGSICAFVRDRLVVGPESAGARPGPACYGAGGPLTITDVNLLLGRLDPARFPIPVDVAAARAAFAKVRDAVAAHEGRPVDDAALLQGFVDVADERMADAIRTVTLRRGVDPRGFALVAFGGAGGQHACAVAERLGVDTVVVPRDASVLSADGLLRAAVERIAARQVLRPLDVAADDLPARWRELDAEAVAAVVAEGEPAESVAVVRRLAELRYVGQDATLDVERPADPSAAALKDAFRARYAEVFGGAGDAGRGIEVVALRVVARGRGVFARGASAPADAAADATPFVGPCAVPGERTTTWLPAGWSATLDAEGALVARRSAAAVRVADPAAPHAVRLELFTNRFRAIADEMGEMLRRTAVSVNIKERLDFSCGLLSADGGLVVNAPHIPVHLGALGACVRKLKETVPCAPGDVYVVNHPAFGGSHLPDVTVVTPVHLPDGSLLGFTASRAHHAELGGVRPGSMPPDATRLAEEGVVIPPTALLRGGAPAWGEVERLLAAPPCPSRNVADNLADLRAAVAANRRGADALLRLAAEHGADAVRAFMDALRVRAASRVRAALARFRPGVYSAEEFLDDGTPLRVALTLGKDGARIDFAGTGGVHPGNLNATPAVVRGCVMYVLRLLVDEDLPLNEGLLEPVDLRLPESLLAPTFDADPARAPAVVGGNVETSQRTVDVLLKALGIAGASQGTMNNVAFGDARFGYYETVCGGAGAGPGFDGRSAVHTHMTNTKITDVEVIERRFPLRIERFAVRRGSGGAGRRRGGDGVVRVYRFLAAMELSLLTQRRASGPYGQSGGGAGAPGRQTLVRAGAAATESVALPSMAALHVAPGDVLTLETPGGGGYGAAVLPG
jgi:5-oxoprolinase (ATP-hydrolysing)